MRMPSKQHNAPKPSNKLSGTSSAVTRNSKRLSNTVNASSSNATSSIIHTQIRSTYTSEPKDSPEEHRTEPKTSYKLWDESLEVKGKDMRLINPVNASSSSATPTSTTYTHIHPAHSPEADHSLNGQDSTQDTEHKSSHNLSNSFKGITGEHMRIMKSGNASSSSSKSTTLTQIRPTHPPEPEDSSKEHCTEPKTDHQSLSDESAVVTEKDTRNTSSDMAMTKKDTRAIHPDKASPSTPTSTRPQIRPTQPDSKKEYCTKSKASQKLSDESAAMTGNTKRLGSTFMASSNVSDECAAMTRKYTTVFHPVKVSSSNASSTRTQIRSTQQDSLKEHYPEPKAGHNLSDSSSAMAGITENDTRVTEPVMASSNLSDEFVAMTGNTGIYARLAGPVKAPYYLLNEFVAMSGSTTRFNHPVKAYPNLSGSSRAMHVETRLTHPGIASPILSDESAVIAGNTGNDSRLLNPVKASSIHSDESVAMPMEMRLKHPVKASSNLSDSSIAMIAAETRVRHPIMAYPNHSDGSVTMTGKDIGLTSPITASPNLSESSPAMTENKAKPPRLSASSRPSDLPNPITAADTRVTKPVIAIPFSLLSPHFNGTANSSSTAHSRRPATRTTKQGISTPKPGISIPKPGPGTPKQATQKPEGKKPATERAAEEIRISVVKETALLFVLIYVLVVSNSLKVGAWQGIVKVVSPSLLNLLATTIVMAILNWLLPTMGSGHWIWPTDDGFVLETVRFFDLLLALIYSAAVFVLATWLTTVYDKVRKSIDDDSIDLTEAEPCPLRIGDFDTAEEGKFISDFNPLSPRRPRAESEIEFYRLESGLNKRKSLEPPASSTASNSGVKSSNPAYPLLIDFAGAGYADIIARNWRSFEAVGKPNLVSSDPFSDGKEEPMSPTPSSKSKRTSTSPIPFPKLKKPPDSSETPSLISRSNQVNLVGNSLQVSISLRMESSLLEEQMKKHHDSAASDEIILEPMLKKHDEDEAMRKALSSAMSSEIGDIGNGNKMPVGDSKEASIGKAFPKFTSIVAPPPRDLEDGR